MTLREVNLLNEEIIKDPDYEEDSSACETQVEKVVEENQEILQKLNELQNELKTQNEQFLRLAAEYDNYRKRSEKDKLSIYNNAKAKTIFEILPIADCIERAIESSSEADAEYKKGLEMLNNQFVASLSKLGVESFGNIGDNFDPELHNAISHIDNNELGENIITQVFQKGYKLGDKIIRHAMVSVAN